MFVLETGFLLKFDFEGRNLKMSVLEDGEEVWIITVGGGCGVFLFRFNIIFILCVGKSRFKGVSDLF